MIARNRAASKALSGPEAGIPGSTPVRRRYFGEFAGRGGVWVWYGKRKLLK